MSTRATPAVIPALHALIEQWQPGRHPRNAPDRRVDAADAAHARPGLIEPGRFLH